MKKTSIPCLPQGLSTPVQEQRAFATSLARTAYNYMFSYLEPLPLSADTPEGEGFSPEYETKVLKAFLPLADNFKNVVVGLLQKEISQDLPAQGLAEVKAVEAAYSQFKHCIEAGFNPLKDWSSFKDLLQTLAELPGALEKSVQSAARLPTDLTRVATGLKSVFEEFEKEGVTAFLRSTFYDLLETQKGRDYLQAHAVKDYDQLYSDLPRPLSMTIEPKSWMKLAKDEQPWEQDWYFGYLQLGGFNTTNLKAVLVNQAGSKMAMMLDELLTKCPLTDTILISVVGSAAGSLKQAAEQGRLYVCDYSMLDGVPCGQMHGQQRFAAPGIAVFYWHTQSPQGYPPGGALQPVAIQLGQKHDPKLTPIFTPNDCTGTQDPNRLKWKIAKLFIQNACAIQHETVAHLGACHMTVEPMVVATHRQLPPEHPILVLLEPHFRFTLKINDSAIHSLVVPGGVVASVLSTTLQGSLSLVLKAFDEWKFDEQSPERIFEERGVGSARLPNFIFRDDTLLLWSAIKNFVRNYLSLYYGGAVAADRDRAVLEDYELQNWVNELVDPEYAAVKGMNGLVPTGNSSQPWRIESFDYLVGVVAQIIYISSAQHASVNYAQYPLMSFLPSVTGSLYAKPPGAGVPLSAEEYVRWLPPLDVSLYQMSFGYLLSGVQFDRLGQYSDDPRVPYFADSRVNSLVTDFQRELIGAEFEISKRNETRPFPYLFQLPSMVPNSISI